MVSIFVVFYFSHNLCVEAKISENIDSCYNW